MKKTIKLVQEQADEIQRLKKIIKDNNYQEKSSGFKVLKETQGAKNLIQKNSAEEFIAFFKQNYGVYGFKSKEIINMLIDEEKFNWINEILTNRNIAKEYIEAVEEIIIAENYEFAYKVISSINNWKYEEVRINIQHFDTCSRKESIDNLFFKSLEVFSYTKEEILKLKKGHIPIFCGCRRRVNIIMKKDKNEGVF